MKRLRNLLGVMVTLRAGNDSLSLPPFSEHDVEDKFAEMLPQGVISLTTESAAPEAAPVVEVVEAVSVETPTAAAPMVEDEPVVVVETPVVEDDKSSWKRKK